MLAPPAHTNLLTYHVRDDPLEKVADTHETQRKGWMRIALFGNFFMPGLQRITTLDT